MLVVVALIAFTLSNAQDLQFPWQMPQYQAGGLSSDPVLKELPQQERTRMTPSSRSQRCVVEQHERIECGEADLTPAECEDISCCSDAQGCYYAKAVTLQCTSDGQFVLVVARDAILPRIRLDSIHMLENDPSGLCAPVDGTATFAIYQFAVSSCGTRMKEENGFVVYENMMTSAYEVGIGPRGSITRDSAYELEFQCRYSGTAVEALVAEVNTAAPPPPPVAPQDPLRVELRLARGQCTTTGCSDEDMYTSYYSEEDHPVTKVLREPVYVEVRILERTDPNIILVLDHCWATSTPEPLSRPQWDLVLNGCPYKDDHYLTTQLPVGPSGLQYPSHYKRFVVKMFTLVDQSSLVPLQERIFIHCATSVCHPSATEACEPSCDSWTRRGVSEYLKDSEKVVVSSGEVIIISHLPVSDHLVDEEVPQILDYGFWVAGALTVFGICGLVVAVIMQRARPRPQPTPV